MLALGIPAALAAAAASYGADLHVAHPASTGAFAATAPDVADGALLAAALHGPAIELTHRGASMSARAAAVNSLDKGCSAEVSVQAPDGGNRWRRMLRWSDVAWHGVGEDGRVMVAFFEHDGRLPGDRLAFRAADPSGFRAALRRASEACRLSSGEGERILSGDHPTSRSCYFARYPALELIEATGPAPDPTRAVVTVLAEETPEAELRLLVEQGVGGEGGGWSRPEVAFTIAGLNKFKIEAVRFALDGVPVEAEHSIVLYGDTRLRIRMDPFAAAGPTGGSFYHRLASARRATVTLLDSNGNSRAVLNFEAGSALAGARKALDQAAWSCTAAVPAPAPAMLWQVAP